MVDLSEIKRPKGRPKILVDRVCIPVNLTSSHLKVLDGIVNGVSSRSEIIRLCIDNLGNDAKYIRLIEENISLRTKVNLLEKKVSITASQPKPKPKPKTQIEIMDEWKQEKINKLIRIYHNHKDRKSFLKSPFFYETADKVKIKYQDLVNIVIEGKVE